MNLFTLMGHGIWMFSKDKIKEISEGELKP